VAGTLIGNPSIRVFDGPAALTLLLLFFIHSAFAAPVSDAQIVLGETTALIDTLRGGNVYTEGKDIGTVIHHTSSEDEAETWVEEDRDFVKQNGPVCTSFQRPGV
jgi:hypothetical protein